MDIFKRGAEDPEVYKGRAREHAEKQYTTAELKELYRASTPHYIAIYLFDKTVGDYLGPDEIVLLPSRAEALRCLKRYTKQYKGYHPRSGLPVQRVKFLCIGKDTANVYALGYTDLYKVGTITEEYQD